MLGGMKRHMLRYALALAVMVSLSSCGTRPPRHAKFIERDLVTTGYCKCKICCGWKRTWYGKPVVASGPDKGQHKQVGITASGVKAKHGTIAADTRLYPFGTIMYVPGYGYGRVEDRGGAIKGHHIDLFFKHHRRALRWGHEMRKVKIWLPPTP